jgi:hypothetical protein
MGIDEPGGDHAPAGVDHLQLQPQGRGGHAGVHLPYAGYLVADEQDRLTPPRLGREDLTVLDERQHS